MFFFCRALEQGFGGSLRLANNAEGRFTDSLALRRIGTSGQRVVLFTHVLFVGRTFYLGM
jgi:hypothetical protein